MSELINYDKIVILNAQKYEYVYNTSLFAQYKKERNEFFSNLTTFLNTKFDEEFTEKQVRDRWKRIRDDYTEGVRKLDEGERLTGRLSAVRKACFAFLDKHIKVQDKKSSKSQATPFSSFVTESPKQSSSDCFLKSSSISSFHSQPVINITPRSTTRQCSRTAFKRPHSYDCQESQPQPPLLTDGLQSQQSLTSDKRQLPSQPEPQFQHPITQPHIPEIVPVPQKNDLQARKARKLLPQSSPSLGHGTDCTYDVQPDFPTTSSQSSPLLTGLQSQRESFELISRSQQSNKHFSTPKTMAFYDEDESDDSKSHLSDLSHSSHYSEDLTFPKKKVNKKEEPQDASGLQQVLKELAEMIEHNKSYDRIRGRAKIICKFLDGLPIHKQITGFRKVMDIFEKYEWMKTNADSNAE